jgi:hypothetical protein
MVSRRPEAQIRSVTYDRQQPRRTRIVWLWFCVRLEQLHCRMPTANLPSAIVMRGRCRFRSKDATSVVLPVAILAMSIKVNGDVSASLRYYGYCEAPRSIEI